jgi:bifunctional non-homologous end joining protein LigD
MAGKSERSDAQRRGATRGERSASRPRARPTEPTRSKVRKAGKGALATPGPVVEQLEAIERAGGSGTIQLARGATLELSKLDKVYFPTLGATKGELMRYYASVAPVILPLMAGRPLVLKRSPEGVGGETFFQQKPPARLPRSVRVESIPAPPAGERGGQAGRAERRLVGDDLATLLYTVQLGCISVDPWLSRVGSIEQPDYAIIDLDPGPEAAFGRVIHAARLVHEEMERLGLRGALKTSGSRGLHIVLPLPPETSYDAAARLTELIARRVAEAHPEDTTIERSLAERPPAAVYLDYLQNARGKSLACAYCARARAGATVSTPLRWSELGDALDPGSFTIRSVPGRLMELGDVWGETMRRANTRRALTSTLSTE